MPLVRENSQLYEVLKVSTISGQPLQTTSELNIPGYDYVSLSYSGPNVTGVVYKTGGVGGTTVATLALTYDGSNNLTSVTRS